MQLAKRTITIEEKSLPLRHSASVLGEKRGSAVECSPIQSPQGEDGKDTGRTGDHVAEPPRRQAGKSGSYNSTEECCAIMRLPFD